MPLREPDLLGFGNPRVLSDATAAAERPEPEPARNTLARPRRARAAKPTDTPPAATTSTAASEKPVPELAAAKVALGDEERVFMQFMAPRVLRRRLGHAAFELDARLPRLSDHQTLIAALLFAHVDHHDPVRLRALGELLDDWSADPVSQTRADAKLGGDVPYSIKRRLEGSALRLKDTHSEASRRAIGCALIWRHVDPDDLSSLDALAETLLAYEAAAWPKRASSQQSAAA